MEGLRVKNIAFYLTMKKDVIHESHNATLRQVVEKMEHHQYTAIPLLDEEGRYVGTVTEGDILRQLRSGGHGGLRDLEKINIKKVHQQKVYKAVRINAEMRDLFDIVVNQNFVPVVDDQHIFIGIIKRSDIISSFKEQLEKSGSL